jgi:hypothetical protein
VRGGEEKPATSAGEIKATRIAGRVPRLDLAQHPSPSPTCCCRPSSLPASEAEGGKDQAGLYPRKNPLGTCRPFRDSWPELHCRPCSRREDRRSTSCPLAAPPLVLPEPSPALPTDGLFGCHSSARCHSTAPCEGPPQPDHAPISASSPSPLAGRRCPTVR